jgi:hypothetical protein
MSIRDYVEHLKGKSEHTRRSIAFAAAGGLTLVIAFGWLTTILSSGVLALEQDGNEVGIVTTGQQVSDDFGGLAGAASALDFSTTENGGELTVVESKKASSTLDREDTGDATVIPF